MEPGELVLSDVHLGCNSSEIFEDRYKQIKLVRSRFLYKENVFDECLSNEIKRNFVDEDGDLDPIRKEEAHYCALYIDHCLATPFEDVGLQVWSSCLLLCDFILDQPKLFETKIVLEMGAGVGLAGLICSRFSKNVLCTDSSWESLQLCERNYHLNNEHWSGCHDNMRITHLDWSEEPSGWTNEDLQLLRTVDIVMASDVIFSNELTNAFIKSLLRVIKDSSKDQIDVYIALEKRLNFTLEERTVACPAYTHFMLSMKNLCSSNALPDYKLVFSQITDTDQHFIYERSKYLELWHLNVMKTQPKIQLS